jgi:hypothetical protein
VVAGNGSKNQWSFAVDATTFKPDEYLVRVSGVTIDVTGSTTFNILEKPVTTIATPTTEIVTPVLTSEPLSAATTVPVTNATQASFPIFAVFGALGLVACSILMKKK